MPGCVVALREDDCDIVVLELTLSVLDGIVSDGLCYLVVGVEFVHLFGEGKPQVVEEHRQFQWVG
ncbi:hypothetical protein [Halobacteriaceae bacterium SHR40]|uniref:hypothetical protein n=1 Tax=Halovenus amylolytica TaxID=2500550 RepID=UPI000FE2F2C2